MVNGIDEKRLSKKHGNIKFFHFSGERIEDINQYIIPIIKKQADYLILNIGTKYATSNTSKKIVDDLLMLIRESSMLIMHIKEFSFGLANK